MLKLGEEDRASEPDVKLIWDDMIITSSWYYKAWEDILYSGQFKIVQSKLITE